jgi:hypothetical protein
VVAVCGGNLVQQRERGLVTLLFDQAADLEQITVAAKFPDRRGAFVVRSRGQQPLGRTERRRGSLSRNSLLDLAVQSSKFVTPRTGKLLEPLDFRVAKGFDDLLQQRLCEFIAILLDQPAGLLHLGPHLFGLAVPPFLNPRDPALHLFGVSLPQTGGGQSAEYGNGFIKSERRPEPAGFGQAVDETALILLGRPFPLVAAGLAKEALRAGGPAAVQTGFPVRFSAVRTGRLRRQAENAALAAWGPLAARVFKQQGTSGQGTRVREVAGAERQIGVGGADRKLRE